MPIDINNVYEQAFEALRHASDFRAKIVGGWAAVYTAFAALFVWAQANLPSQIWAVTLFWVLMHTIMWLADLRNRPAIGRAKDVGKAIELDSANMIKEEWQFFNKLDKGMSHSLIIDIFFWLGLLIGATAVFYCKP